MKDIGPPKHPNDFEHQETLFIFLSYFVLYGTLGGILGRSIDKSISFLKNDEDSRQKRVLLFLLQILVNGIIFYFAFQTITFKFKNATLSLDDWMGSTFQGLIFATTMYAMQNNLYDDLRMGLF